jgi:hypothetical protein
MSVCCVLSDRGLCDGPIPRPEESYRLWCVIVWDQQTSKKEAALARVGLLCQAIIIRAVKENTKGLVFAVNGIVLEVNAEKTECIVMSRVKHAGRSHVVN